VKTSYWIIWAALLSLNLYSLARIERGATAVDKVVYSRGGVTISINEFKSEICPCLLFIAHALLLMVFVLPGAGASFRSFMAEMVSGGSLLLTWREMSGIGFTDLSAHGMPDWPQNALMWHLLFDPAFTAVVASAIGTFAFSCYCVNGIKLQAASQLRSGFQVQARK
jgi:hypothetical protein